MSRENCTDRLAELNVVEQAMNVAKTTVVQDAWRRGQAVSVHGWIYRLRNGIIRDLGFSAASESDIAVQYETALRALVAKESRA